MLAIVHACALIGLDGRIIEVQTDFNSRATIPVFNIVGLPDNAVKESRERVKSAIKNSRLQFPMRGYTVNLSPADVTKHGPAYDLPIAIGCLAATDQVPLTALEGSLFLGELSLDGRVGHVKGIMPMVHGARQAGFERAYVPAADAAQAALVGGIDIFPVATLGELVEHLYGMNPIPAYALPPEVVNAPGSLPEGLVDFADIKGQQHVKRALEIAAAGNHNIRLSGPPGVGKTLMARAIPGILPLLTREEALEVTRIYSVADMLEAGKPLMRHRPFRAPHHTISAPGLVGGGSIPRPGEISLAHRGVLFLDEFNEFPANALEVLRQPMEDKIVTISRSKAAVTFPANFLLIAAHNPCPCGYFSDTAKACTCTPDAIRRYQSKLSGPLLDRIDMHVEVPRVDVDKLMATDKAEASAAVRARVEAARATQQRRFQGRAGLFANGDMGPGDLQTWCVLSPEAQQLAGISVKRLQLSARAYHRVLKLSRTIADLDGSDRIEVNHLAEAIQYRPRTTSE
jgi:magnesium chelatase family protein